MTKKINLSFVLMFFCVVFFSITCNAFDSKNFSDKTIVEYNSENGLLNNMGNALASTDDGYMWIGQYAGLTKYNGKRFQTINELDGIELNGIKALYSSCDKLYIGTQESFLLYENERLKKLDLDYNEGIYVSQITEYNDSLYISTSKGLYSYKNDYSAKLVEGNVKKVAVNDLGLFYINDNNFVKSLNNDDIIYYEPIKTIYSYNNNLYMGSIDGNIIIFDGLNFKKTSITNTSINKLFYYDDTLYIGADDGLYVLNNDNVEKIKTLNNIRSIEDIMVDYQGNLWIISSSNGLFKIVSNVFDNLFVKYNVTDFLNTKLNISNVGVNKVTKYNDLLYIGTEDCLIIIDEKNNLIIENDLVNALLNKRIRDLIVFNNKLYIATYEDSLVEYDGVNIKKYDSALFTENNVYHSDSTKIRCFTKTDDYLFVGTNYGISRIDKFGEIKSIRTIDRPLYLTINNNFLYACLDNSNGIHKLSFDLADNEIINGTNDKTILKCYFDNDLFLYSSNNYLYVAGNNINNRICLDGNGSIVEIFKSNNKYFIGTQNNIYIISESEILNEKPKYCVLTKNDGLKQGLSANATGYLDYERGVYYFSGRDSVYCYDLNKKERERIHTKIALSSVEIDGEIKSIKDGIKLDKESNRLVFYIDVLNYTNYDNYKILYKLENIDTDFNEISVEEVNRISYNNISGGEYNLIVKLVDESGNFGENEIKISVVKEKKFIETTLSIVLIVLANVIFLVFLGFLIAHLVNRRNEKRNKELKKITIESIETVARTIDAKDPYTNGHSIRVGKYSKIIAEALGMSADEVENIYYIGLLHDIGKIAIDRAILNKPGALTKEEYEIIKTHTIEGEKILKSISTIPEIVNGAKYHHERYDGHGYPSGLKGENIPFIARIVCCADSFDAMSTKRSYKDKYSKERIIEEFIKCSGTQFDPKIAKVVIKLIKEDKL